MITLEKLRTYQEFNGDIDGWARASKDKTKSLMTDTDWYLIDELLMGLTTIETGIASASFVIDIKSKILASTLDEPTRVALHTLFVSKERNRAA